MDSETWSKFKKSTTYRRKMKQKYEMMVHKNEPTTSSSSKTIPNLKNTTENASGSVQNKNKSCDLMPSENTDSQNSDSSDEYECVNFNNESNIYQDV